MDQTGRRLHICFTGCAGNIAAGKYNDGALIRRPILTHRLYEGIARSEQGLKPEPIAHVRWRTAELIPSVNPNLSAEALEAMISDRTQRVVDRNRPAFDGYEVSVAFSDPSVDGALTEGIRRLLI